MRAVSRGAVWPLWEASRTVPIVFAIVADPVAAGYVESLARPGGNATGFTLFEYSTSGKWLELLKEIAPRVKRAAVLRDASIAPGLGEFGVIQALAPSLGVELRPVDVRDAGEIERATTAFAQGSDGGMIGSGTPSAVIHRGLIAGGQASLAHSLPQPRLRRRRRSHFLWCRFRRPVSARGILHRPHSQGGETH